MKKSIFLLLIIPSLIFASAYFYGNTIQYLGPDNSLNGNFYFSSYRENTIYLEEYKVNVNTKDFILSLIRGEDLFKYKKDFKFIKTEKYSPNGKSLNKKIVLSKSTGIYYFKLTNSNKYLAHSYVFVSNLKAINLNDTTTKQLYLRSSVTGEKIDKATVYLQLPNKIIQLNLTNGFLNLSKYSYSNVYVCTDNAFTSLYNYVGESNNFAVYVTTDRPIYRPGQKVNFKGFFLKKSKSGYESISDKTMEVKIYDPNDSLIYDKKLKTNSFGTLFGNLITNSSAPVGYYRISFYYNKYHFSDGFYVQAYKKPTFFITISSDKDKYVYKDKMDYTVSLKYFNGQPVVGAKATIYLYADNDNYYYYDHSSKLLYYNSFATDSKGEIKLPLILNEKLDGYCRMEVVAVDETQREVDKTYSVKIYQGNINFRFDKYYINVKPNQKFDVGFTIKDLKGNDLSGEASAVFCGKTYKTKVVNGVGKLTLLASSIGNFPLVINFKGCTYKTYVYSYEFGYSDFSPSDITIFTDKDEYSPSSTVKVAIYSPNYLKGLLFVGGEKIYYLEKINENKRTLIKNIKLPDNLDERSLWAVYIPFQSSDNNYYDHKFSINLNTKKLQISIKTDKKTYRPKDIVHLHISSNKDSDIAISVVDKAIYYVKKQNDNIFDSIYPKFNYLQMEISFSSKYVPYNLISRLQSPNIFAQTKKDYKFASFKSKQALKTNVRKYFPDTALWIPSKILKNGECNIDFKMPDSITSWRIRALGISKDMKVGETSTDIVATKEFYVHPILPMFFREGDVTQIGMTVFNNTSNSTTVKLNISTSKGIFLKDPSDISFVIKPHSSETFYKQCSITYVSTVSSIEIEAKSKGLYDRVIYKVPVYPYTLDRKIYKLMIINNETKTYKVEKKDYYNLQMRVLSSFKPIIKDSLQRLISYPYGCVEQTMSSFLPAIVAKSYKMKFDNLNDIINKGLMKLFTYQHRDGGWGWWLRDKSLPWMSEYVMNGLYYAKQSGYDVPKIIIENGLNYLKKHLDGYSVYVLSLYNIKVNYSPKSIIDEIYMSSMDKSYIPSLISRLKNKGDYSYLDIKTNDFFTTNVQLNSIFLRSLIKYNQDPKVIKRVLRYIISKKDGTLWYDTKDTSFAAIALMAYDKSFKINLKVNVDGKSTLYATDSFIKPVIGENYEFVGNGIVEIQGKYKDVPKLSVDEGIKVQRNLFKKLQVVGTDPKGDKTIIDAVLPLNGNFTPISVKAEKYDKYFIYNNKILLKYVNEIEDYDFTFNNKYFEINEKGLKVNGKQLIKKPIVSLKGTSKELMIVVKDGYYLYDFNNLKFVKFDNIIDGDISKDEIIVLTKDNLHLKNKKYTTTIKLNKVYKSVSISDQNVYLTDSYINLLNDNKIEKLYPVSADFVCSISNNKLVLAGNVKFLGNRNTIGPLGLYSISFKKENYQLKVGDIVMTNINLQSDEGNYMIIEDYFPSCAQVLKKYSEKRFTGNYKLDYMWYGDWDYWYLSRELRDEKIGFFTYSFDKNSISYYYRLTTSGKYKILPTQAYTMYQKGIYGQSSPDFIIVH